MLGVVKELHYIGLQAAVLKVVGIIALGGAALASFFRKGTLHGTPIPHFSSQAAPAGIYAGLNVFYAPHTKYVFRHGVCSPSSQLAIYFVFGRPVRRAGGAADARVAVHRLDELDDKLQLQQKCALLGVRPVAKVRVSHIFSTKGCVLPYTLHTHN